MEARLHGLASPVAEACAPRELALARANLEFARAEVRQGDPRRAREHLSTAELNARAAQKLLEQSNCQSTTVLPPSPRPTTAQGPDRDHDGLPDRRDGCPDAPEDLDGYRDTDGCPDVDDDADGVPDTQDRCPDQLEDRDGFQDDDGCPDFDNDGDGVLDSADRCPLLPGTAITQGCARLDYRVLEVKPRELRLRQPIEFEVDSPAISSVSHPLLETIALALQEHPEITVEIQVHTDSSGSAVRNLQLSQSRAESVQEAIQAYGIDPSRLTARGYGETRPIESNRTSQGRSVNRRVEFIRTDGASTAVQGP